VQFQLGDPVGAVTAARTPEDFAKYIRQETDRWGEVIRANNIKLD
jgi:tripartite-type tricarboxylate transporter receptor subunit TctC